jgi:UDP-GlcNAc:undecaprenyl-phosphate GlcNAc-1-phosphate transferase
MVFMLALVLAFIITFLITPGLIYLAKIWHIFDLPDGRLKQHHNAIPYLGGIAVFAGFMISFLTTSLVSYNLWALTAPILLLTILLLFLGLWDDLYILSPKIKLLGQLMTVILCLLSNFVLGGDLCNRTIIELVLIILWFLTVINAFNLIDVMDGLTSTVAIMFCATLIFFAINNQNYLLVTLLLSLIGALIAFLFYNFPPAKIYLGDSGSLMLGGLIAYLPFTINWTTYNKLGFIIPIVLLAVPLLELAGLITIRSYKHLPIYLGSPDHFSHYLQKKGWGRRQILAFIVCCASLFATVAWGFFLDTISFKTVVLLGAGFNLGWGWLIFF